LRLGGLPIGLAHHMVLKRDISAGHVVSWSDVDFDASSQVVKVRREMEEMFRREWKL
jgi:predicted homoserine dehydrogenase-like protein